MMKQQIVLGVDGGGTNTRCVAINRQGTWVVEGRAASRNRNSVGLEIRDFTQAISNLLPKCNKVMQQGEVE